MMSVTVGLLSGSSPHSHSTVKSSSTARAPLLIGLPSRLQQCREIGRDMDQFGREKLLFFILLTQS